VSAQIAMLALTLISGLGSAFFWWRSASVRFEITTRDEGENTDAGAFIFEKGRPLSAQGKQRKHASRGFGSRIGNIGRHRLSAGPRALELPRLPLPPCSGGDKSIGQLPDLDGSPELRDAALQWRRETPGGQGRGNWGSW
jgi:hypothetical protein